MTARDRWIDEGIALLREGGAEALRVDVAARRLGLTKGSFHHHFAGAPQWRRAVLDRYERDMLDAMDAVRTGIRSLPPADAIAALPQYLGRLDMALDTAVRGWALHDAAAREVLARSDAARLTLLEECWRAQLGDTPRAAAAALIPHLIAIGAAVAQPPPDPAQLEDAFALLARLVPAVT